MGNFIDFLIFAAVDNEETWDGSETVGGIVGVRNVSNGYNLPENPPERTVIQRTDRSIHIEMLH